MSNENQTVAAPVRKPKELKTLRDHLESEGFANQMAMVLPKHLTPQRMARVAVTAMTRTPKLAQCDQASFFAAMLTCSQIGLEPDGRLAHLIPYGTTCQLIIDWKGLAQLAYRSGMVSTLHADVIYSGDLLDYSCGEIRSHVPHFLRTDVAKPMERGTRLGAYAIASMKDGAKMAAVMSADEIQGIRKRSKSGSSGPWVTDENEMWKKTSFRRLSKWLPLESEKYREALEADDNGADAIVNVTPEPAGVDRFIGAKPVAEIEDNGGEPVTTARPHHQNAPKLAADPRTALGEIVEGQGCTVADLVEVLIGDAAILPADAGAIKTWADVPSGVAMKYLGADGLGEEVKFGLTFVLENRKQ